MRWSIAVLVLGALALEPSGARAALEFPIVFQVVGSGEPARLYVSAIATPSPCDAPAARRIFDAMVPMNSEVSIVSPSACFCYRNGSGYFRSKDLGAHHSACFPRFYGDTLPMRVRIDVK